MISWIKNFFGPKRKQKKIIKHLLSLGSTSEEVANSLQQRNIKGTPHKCSDCPIANFLRSEKLLDGSIFVGPLSISDGPGNGFFYSSFAPAISDFVGEFDQGKHPQLEKTIPTFSVMLQLSDEELTLLSRAKNGHLAFDESERAQATKLVNLGLGIWGDFYDSYPEMTSTSLLLTKEATDILNG